MSLESFYGGRIGASFVIVKHFDGINIPQPKDGESGTKTYRAKLYAYKLINNEIYLLTDNNELIEKNTENFDEYDWTRVELKGQTVNTVNKEDMTDFDTKSLDEILAQGMVQCFERGGESTNEVNYGEYVIIDTIIELHKRNDPDNGKVFRRGMNFNDTLAGAEYVGQIIGPQGDTPDVGIDRIETIMAESGAQRDSYTLNSSDIIPGKEIVDGQVIYHDEIQYAWVNIKDNGGNIDKALIGFKFPYLVVDFIAEQRSPYYTSDDTDDSSLWGKRIPDNAMNLSEQVEPFNHAYFEKWKIKIPHGISGDAIKELEVSPTRAKAGSVVYSDSECTIPTGEVVSEDGLPLDYLYEDEEHQTATHTPQDENKNISRPLKIDPDISIVGYVKLEDCEKDNIIYKQYNYDNLIDGEYQYKDLGEYNMIKDIELENDGTLIIIYTNHETKVFEKAIKWIDEISLDEDGHFKLRYNTNSITDIDNPNYYDLQVNLKNITDVQIDTGIEYDNNGDEITKIDDRGQTVRTEGDGTQKVEVEYSKDGNYHAIGAPLNYIVDTYIVPKGDEHNLARHLLVYYSNPDIRHQSPIETYLYPSKRLRDPNADPDDPDPLVPGWTDVGYAVGTVEETLIFSEYPTKADIPNYPPEVIMGTLENPDYAYAGWGALYTGDTGQFVAQWDYVNGGWTDGYSYGSNVQSPDNVIGVDFSKLFTLGYQIQTVNRKVANEISKDLIIKLIRKNDKDDPTNITTSFIGSEARYIGPQRNSNNNNLEEQLMIGTDISSSYNFSELSATTSLPNRLREEENISFKTSSSTSDYYTLTKVTEKDLPVTIDSVNKKMILNLNPKVYSHTEALKFNTTTTSSDDITTTITTNVSDKNTVYTYIGDVLNVVQANITNRI